MGVLRGMSRVSTGDGECDEIDCTIPLSGVSITVRTFIPRGDDRGLISGDGVGENGKLL